jgi:rhodanese-related sulfurtransferase
LFSHFHCKALTEFVTETRKNTMNLWIAVLFLIIIGWMLWTKFRFSVGRERARELIASGALVLDVRNANEFASRNLPGAINLPLSDVAGKIGSVEADKDRVILCHCVSGARSGMAVCRLRKLGYSQAFNLGSYHNAESVLRSINADDGESGR